MNHPWPLAAWVMALLVAFGLLSAQAQTVKHGVSAGTFIITQSPDVDDNANATNTVGMSINDFRARGANRGDYDVQIGAIFEDDITNGILISCVIENGRNNFGTNNYPISAIHDGYYIATFVPSVPGSGGSAWEYNVNVAGAWFPYDKYLGGLARSSVRVNNGSNDLLIASKEIVYGTHFQHIAISNELAAAGGWLANAGRSVIDLRTLGIDSRRDGVLLVNGAKNENNWALSQVNVTNGTWTIYLHDNATGSAASYEQDPVAFVYIPRDAPDLVSGRFNGDASIAMYSGNSPQFTVTNVGSGRWILTLDDYTPTDGILIISAEGGGTYNLDNIVSYQATPDGKAWEIQSRDTPNNGLQTPYTVINGANFPEAVASFVFIPAPPVGFTTVPSANLLTSENGETATLTVALNAKPTADVTINVSSSDLTEAMVDVSSLTFTPENWVVPQTINVYGMDDAEADGQVAYTIVLSPATSTDPRFNGLDPQDVGGLSADNEAAITISANKLATSESGGIATFTVVLSTMPTADVTIGLSSSDATEGTVAPASLVFTSMDYYLPQTVTVTGVDDLLGDGDTTYTILTAAAVSADSAYNGKNALDVTVVNEDNDTARITINPVEGLTVSESGSTANFTVALQTQPAADVTVNFTVSDPTEGSVSPASVTFTPADYATPKTFTLTGVNDDVNDGPVSYTLNGTVTSTDVGYAAIQPLVYATTLDNEAELTLPSGTLVYGIGWPGMGIDGLATITDPDTADYDTGTLTVTLAANASADDRLAIRSTGTEVGQISVSGANVSYGGVAIGTFAGGTGTAPLVVTFNSASTPEAAQALLRNVTFHNVSATPTTAPRQLTVALADGDGGTSTASKVVELSLVHISDFQEGKDGGFGVYSGGKDLEILALTGLGYPAGSVASGMQVSWASGAMFPDEEALLRFDNIIGTNPGQIPPNATIVEADLMLYVVNQGDGSPLHRMLVPWDAEYDSWQTLGDGIQTDDVEAKVSFYSQIGVTNLSGSTGTGTIRVSVMPDVQSWVNGEANHGWVMPGWYLSGNADATIFAPSESTNVVQRPRLVVKWIPADIASASFRQGVNDYTGAVDTRIRQFNPDTEYSTIDGIFVDYEVTTGMEDPEHAFIRFDEIIGAGEGQIPPGSTIHAAILDLASIISNAMGAGGRIHRMLKPWEANYTWNDFVEGVEANDIEAASAPTIVAGNSERTPIVQGGYLTFQVTSDVQAWANGTPNYGWALLPWPYGSDGWGFGTSEQLDERNRPQLRVFYTPGSAPESITLQAPVVTANTVLVAVKGTATRTYSIERAGAITGAWTKIGEVTTAADGTATYTDNTPLPGAAFYRVVYP